MSDWKEEYTKRESEKARLAEQKRKEEELERTLREREENQRELQRKLERHMRKFKCHICGKPSRGPDQPTFYGPGNENPSSWGGPTYWDRPTELYKCQECGKWACWEHTLHRSHNDYKCMRCCHES